MQYPSIRVEGAILSGDIIDAIERGEKGFQKAKDFGLDPTSKVKDEIASTWADARDQWRIYARKVESLKEGATGTTETRNFWMSPFLGLLGYNLELAARGEEVNGRNYHISHRDTSRGGFPIHIVGCNDSLDKRRAEGGKRMSPHALVQEYLNLTEHLYAVVTNGRLLRLLRDSTRLVKLSFLEFDLDRIFEEELFADFAILYRLLHASRMPVSQDSAAESVIEIYHQDALDSGSRIREGLSEAVERSIKSLANGFLQHPANDDLRESIRSGKTDNKTFYQWQLRLIYRLLFLMVIEERDLVFAPDAERRFRDIYYDYYGIGRLRRLSEHRHFADSNFQDAWTGLRHTFQLFEDSGYGQKLGIAPLAGDLFDWQAIGVLNDCQLDNEILLTCLRNLNLFTNPITGQRMRVNYAALNVEEFGSVYEGLLEYDPQILDVEGQCEFSFVAGDDRAASGSHYTPDELVQPLIKHSLDYIIADKLKESDAEQALLSITICDVACGSGHILLNAARRIATELAILRTGEDQPSPSAFRAAVRDVIRNCIYGVDLNPLAVELCKVGLWLEAHVPGEPLNFLDHHIKCGNAIVGLASREELQRGIPDKAFKTLPGDDKTVAAELRKQNKEERKGYQSLDFSGSPADDLDALRSDFSSVAKLPENTPEEIRQKQEAYDEFRRGIHLRNLRTLADIQVAQFYIPKTPNTRRKITTHDQYRRYLRGEHPHPEPTAYAQAIAHRKRFFHWFLEFPNVFTDGGFDCILGNPPFLNNRALKRTYGPVFLEWVRYEYAPAGAIDLVGYFFRRVFDLLRAGGIQGLIATNTIAQGNTRDGSISVIRDRQGIIHFAVRSMPWPGRAAVHVALSTIAKDRSFGPPVLGNERVEVISSSLTVDDELPDPEVLLVNSGTAFQGSILNGSGFVLSVDEAHTLVESDARNSAVLRPYLIGNDVNNRPDQSASRWAINFFDWDEAQAGTYGDCFDIVVQRVKPERTRKDDDGNFVLRQPLPTRWWVYADKRPQLYGLLSTMDRTLVVAKTTKYFNFAFVPCEQVLDQQLTVIAFSDFSSFAILQSTVSDAWAREHGTTHETRARYNVKCFETFPICEGTQCLERIGETYHSHRGQLTVLANVGFTALYNLFHDRNLSPEAVAKASKQDADVAAEVHSGLLRLRELHREMDEAVLAAYGWHEPSDDGPPIDLRHDFYEVDYLPENDRVRFTIHPEARRELLKRLLILNHKRHAEEVEAEKKKKATKKKAPKKKSAKRKAKQTAGPTLFDTQAEE